MTNSCLKKRFPTALTPLNRYKLSHGCHMNQYKLWNRVFLKNKQIAGLYRCILPLVLIQRLRTGFLWKTENMYRYITHYISIYNAWKANFSWNQVLKQFLNTFQQSQIHIQQQCYLKQHSICRTITYQLHSYLSKGNGAT